MKLNRLLTAPLLLVLALAACAPGSATPPGQGEPQATAPQRALVIISRGQPPNLAAKSLQPYSASLAAPVRLFNAMLDYVDEREASQPYLADSTPRLGTDTWIVSPDGRMETTYHLRPNLTWHDGEPLAAADFVFAWQVYATPELGTASSDPVAAMAEVAARDERTVVIRWRRLYADAAALDLEFQALPRHILAGPFQQLDAQAFPNLPFWTQEYVGLGPYCLEAWQPGASIAGAAFAGHALGKPKIDRIQVNFTGDSNAALASMLSGEAHYLSDFIFWYEEGTTLEQEWASRGSGGTVMYAPGLMRPTEIQMRPEYANPRALLDVRVRRGLAHGMDAPSVVETTTGGRGLLSWSLTSPQASYYPTVEATLHKHLYDPNLAQQYLEEAGLVRGPDGLYALASGEPFRLQIATDGGTTNERENAIYVDNFRRLGIDAYSFVIPVAQLLDNQARNSLPALNTGGIAVKALGQFTTAAVPRAENRWAGSNRGGWATPEFDGLWQAYSTALDRSERIRQIAGMEEILSRDVALIPNLFTLVVNARVAALQGPVMRTTPGAGLGILHVETWEWSS